MNRWSQLYDHIERHLKVMREKSPRGSLPKFDIKLDEPTPMDELCDILELLSQGLINTNSRGFLNQLYSPGEPAAILGDMMASLYSSSMATREMTPMVSQMETYLIKKMGSLCGFKKCEGTFLSGGSNGNMMALLMARNLKDSQAQGQGVTKKITRSPHERSYLHSVKPR